MGGAPRAEPSSPGGGFMFASALARPLHHVGADAHDRAISRRALAVRASALKYGMRDRLSCPVGGRWVVTYWSNTVPDAASCRRRCAPSFSWAQPSPAIRLQRILPCNPERLGCGVGAHSAAELSVLRMMSFGHQVEDTAKLLNLGGQIVRSHLKKAQSKLGVPFADLGRGASRIRLTSSLDPDPSGHDVDFD